MEAISPTPDDRTTERDDVRSTKEDLLQKISKVDREIAKAESQIAKLKKKQVLINFQLIHSNYNFGWSFRKQRCNGILRYSVETNNQSILFFSTSSKMPPTSQAQTRAQRRTLLTRAWRRWCTAITGSQST